MPSLRAALDPTPGWREAQEKDAVGDGKAKGRRGGDRGHSVLMGDNRPQGLHPAAFKPRERLGDAFLDVPHLPKSRVPAALGISVDHNRDRRFRRDSVILLAGFCGSPSLVRINSSLMAKGQLQKKNIKKKPLKSKAEKRAEKIARKNKRQ